MQLHNSFTVAADVDTAWRVLLDVPRIAPCMPGAELTEAIDERHFKGNAKVRVGPVQLSFAGEAELVEVDAAGHTARLTARGNDTKGRGAAQADVTFSMVAENGATRVDIATDLNLTGSVAQYGRAAGLIGEIAAQIIADFAKNLAAQLAAETPAGGVTAPAGAAAAEPREVPAPPAPAAGNAISGVRLLLRALAAMIRRWLGGGGAA